jgi:hypothetical protein
VAVDKADYLADNVAVTIADMVCARHARVDLTGTVPVTNLICLEIVR